MIITKNQTKKVDRNVNDPLSNVMRTPAIQILNQWIFIKQNIWTVQLCTAHLILHHLQAPIPNRKTTMATWIKNGNAPYHKAAHHSRQLWLTDLLPHLLATLQWRVPLRAAQRLLNWEGMVQTLCRIHLDFHCHLQWPTLQLNYKFTRTQWRRNSFNSNIFP